MVDSTGSGDIVDEGAAGAAELVVERDAGGEAEEALEDAFFDAGEGAGAVPFEREQVFAGPEDRLDPLPDRCQVSALVPGSFLRRGRMIVASRSATASAKSRPAVAFVAEQRLAAAALTE